ncbi:MAG: NADP-dependent oxidoreductase [Gammaproteobacteria bacterium]|nr:NADP-dependent oxidoreductase [Gammaproteobacteria bacterium]
MAKSNDWGGPNRQWVIAEHPVTTLEARHFEYREAPVAEPGPGEVLLKTHLLNIAPVMRMYMMEGGAAGEAPLEIGEVIHGRGVAEVIASNHAGFAPGEFVQGQLGWQTWKVSRMTDAEKFRRLKPHGLPIHHALTVFGMTGFSAYCGFFGRGQPRPSDAVLVSGAAGGVGSLVVQMARLHGCAPLVGIAGGPEKCSLIEKLGCDVAIDYKADDVAAAIRESFPAGVDLYFDNVGGEILEAALGHLAPGARVVLCGSISEYQRQKPFGPRNYTNLRRANADMRGFFVYNHSAEFDAAEAAMAAWLTEGKLKAPVDVVSGFEAMPRALMDMFESTGGGKRIVQVVEGDIACY